MRHAAQGNRVRGFPCYKTIETDREAVRLPNTCRQTGGLTSPALPHGGSSAAGARAERRLQHRPRLTWPMSPDPEALASGHNGYVQARRVAGLTGSVGRFAARNKSPADRPCGCALERRTSHKIRILCDRYCGVAFSGGGSDVVRPDIPTRSRTACQGFRVGAASAPPITFDFTMSAAR